MLMDDRQAIAVISMAYRVRERAREAVNQLQAKNIQVVMITGDAQPVAKTVAQDLGIDHYYARILPEDKVKIISKLKQSGVTAFVGDAINDAAALLEANIGIASGAGTNGLYRLNYA